MNRFAVLLFVAALTNSHAVGAIVQFSPEVFYVPFNVSGTHATFDVTVIPEVEGGFDTADVLFYSDYGLTMVDFQYSADWHAAFATVPDAYIPGIFPSDLWITGNNPTLNDIPSLFAGVLTVDFAGLRCDELYRVTVDGDMDGFSSLGQQGVADLARGSAGVMCIPPEPTTLGLLAMASLAMLRRPGRQK